MQNISPGRKSFEESSGGIFNPDGLQGVVRGLSESRIATPDGLTNQLVEDHLAAVDLGFLIQVAPSEHAVSPSALEAAFQELDQISTEEQAKTSELTPMVLIRYKTAKWLRALYPEEKIHQKDETTTSKIPVDWSDLKRPLQRALERGHLYKYICRPDGSGCGYSRDQIAAAFQDPSDILLANVLNDHAYVYYFDRKDTRPFMKAASANKQALSDGAIRDEARFLNNASSLGLLLGVLRRVDTNSDENSVDPAATRANQLVPFVRHRIMPFPDSYTKFHHVVRAMCDFEYPAVCVSCGLVVDAGRICHLKGTLRSGLLHICVYGTKFCFRLVIAGGKGLCTAHVGECTGASGAFFLLQVFT
jgi:hypothetical protein